MDPGQRENLAGILLMCAAMLCFAIEDVFVKHLAGQIQTGEILAILGCGGFVVFSLIARHRGTRVFTNQLWTAKMLLRNVGEILGTTSYVLAIWLVPLSTAGAIIQATPLAVTLGAALFLGQPVGWRRWAAIMVGFAGVLIVVRPGVAGFQPAALLAVLTVIGLSIRDLATRAMRRDVSNMYMAAWGFGVLVPVGAAMTLATGGAKIPDPAQWALLACALFFATLGYYLLILAMRMGEVAVVTPFRYARLLFAVFFGMLVFAERPDALTIAGSVIIIGSGLFTFYRERMRRNRL